MDFERSCGLSSYSEKEEIMKKMTMWLGLVLFVSLIMTVGPAAAAGPAGISISGAVIPFVDGYAGSGYGGAFLRF